VELSGAVTVVTGGASGIGAALCARLSAVAGVVVVADLQEERARDVADSLRPGAAAQVWHHGVDVADRAAVRALVAGVLERHGRVDLYASNAGIGSAAGVEADPFVWQRVWEVNVMAHVHATDALLPHWLGRGEGHLLVTASAAGLLTNLGDAPYSVTKHAAVAFAEWVSITHGDAGVGVSCLCPQGVRTPLLLGPDDGAALATEVVKAQRILEPDEVAAVTLEALAEDRFLVLPHEEVAGYEQARAADRERWLAAMRRLQARLTGG
jgi:NAD(P)-dependent dehydrogenase (short-subunit alcohol dehydrogenase family)